SAAPWRRPDSAGRRPGAASTATATARSRGRSFRATTPTSPGSTATATSRSTATTSTSRPTPSRPRRVRWSSSAPTATATARLPREEIAAFFARADSGGQGFLSLSALQDAFRAPAAPPRGASGSPTGPPKETLIRGLFRQEIGSLQPGPALGESVPDFTLKTV